MKNKIPPFFAGILSAVLFFTLCVGALAASGNLDIGNAKIALSGNTVIDAGENIVAENGLNVPAVVAYTDESGGVTNYLSIRMLAQLFGTGIEWNDDTQTVELAQKILYTDLKMDLTKFSSTGLTLRLENSSDRVYYYGAPYSLQYWQDGKWLDYPTADGNPLIFNMIAYELKLGETQQLSVDWQNAYGELPEGEYRILKNLSESDGDNNWTLACTFML